MFPVIDMAATGRNIQRLREESGMSVRELQEKFGFTSPQAIYKWQWGVTLPDMQNMLYLAALWNVSIEEILVLENQASFFSQGCTAVCFPKSRENTVQGSLTGV